jgi:hypothetical protein
MASVKGLYQNNNFYTTQVLVTANDPLTYAGQSRAEMNVLMYVAPGANLYHNRTASALTMKYRLRTL